MSRDLDQSAGDAMIEPSLTYQEAYALGEIHREGNMCVTPHPEEARVNNVKFRGRFPILPFHVISVALMNYNVAIYKIAKREAELREDEELVKQGAIKWDMGPQGWLDRPLQPFQLWKTVSENSYVIMMHFFPQDTYDGTLNFANQKDKQELMTATEADGIKFWDYSTGVCLTKIPRSGSCTIANPLGNKLLLSFHDVGKIRLTELQSKNSKVNSSRFHYRALEFSSDTPLKNVFLGTQCGQLLTYHVDSSQRFELVNQLARPCPRGHSQIVEFLHFIPGDPCQIAAIMNFGWFSLFNVVYCTYPSDRVSHLVPHSYIMAVSQTQNTRISTMFRRGNDFHIAIPGKEQLCFFRYRVGEYGKGELEKTDLAINIRTPEIVNVHPSGRMVVASDGKNVLVIRRYAEL